MAELVAPSPELADTLRLLAKRLGFAARKSKPGLSSSHVTRLLSPIYDILDDIRAELRAGSVSQNVGNAEAHIQAEIQLLASLAIPCHRSQSTDSLSEVLQTSDSEPENIVNTIPTRSKQVGLSGHILYIECVNVSCEKSIY